MRLYEALPYTLAYFIFHLHTYPVRHGKRFYAHIKVDPERLGDFVR